MFRLAKFLVVLGFGVYLGFQFNTVTMRSKCGNIDGAWTGGVCVVSEISK